MGPTATGRVGDVTRRRGLPLVAVGGAAGAVARWALLAAATPPQFPWPTLLINLVGCGLLGILMGRRTRPSTLLLVGTGLCGGLTTFSTFAVEVADLLRHEDGALGLAYLAASVVGGLAAFRGGRSAGMAR